MSCTSVVVLGTSLHVPCASVQVPHCMWHITPAMCHTSRSMCPVPHVSYTSVYVLGTSLHLLSASLHVPCASVHVSCTSVHVSCTSIPVPHTSVESTRTSVHAAVFQYLVEMRAVIPRHWVIRQNSTLSVAHIHYWLKATVNLKCVCHTCLCWPNTANYIITHILKTYVSLVRFVFVSVWLSVCLYLFVFVCLLRSKNSLTDTARLCPSKYSNFVLLDFVFKLLIHHVI